jgi:hypothetical protein
MDDLRMRLYDNLDPIEAVLKAWTQYGTMTRQRERMQKTVRDANPLLARALDRLEG